MSVGEIDHTTVCRAANHIYRLLHSMATVRLFLKILESWNVAATLREMLEEGANVRLIMQKTISQLKQRTDTLLPRGELSTAANDVVSPFWSLQSPEEITKDLIAIAQEFPCLEIDLQRRTIQVTTRSIILEDLDLGPFKVTFTWPDVKAFLASVNIYHMWSAIASGQSIQNLMPSMADTIKIEALNPIEPGRLAHPHVRSDGKMCFGEGLPILATALEQGRLMDAFFLVNEALQSYNPGSVYIRIEELHQLAEESEPMRVTVRRCPNCRENLNENEGTSHCHHCNTVTCSRCSYEHSCPGRRTQRRILCRACSWVCPSCQSCTVCDRCAAFCASCRRLVCSSCLQNGNCRACAEAAATVAASAL